MELEKRVFMTISVEGNDNDVENGVSDANVIILKTPWNGPICHIICLNIIKYLNLMKVCL